MSCGIQMISIRSLMMCVCLHRMTHRLSVFKCKRKKRTLQCKRKKSTLDSFCEILNHSLPYLIHVLNSKWRSFVYQAVGWFAVVLFSFVLYLLLLFFSVIYTVILCASLLNITLWHFQQHKTVCRIWFCIFYHFAKYLLLWSTYVYTSEKMFSA